MLRGLALGALLAAAAAALVAAGVPARWARRLTGVMHVERRLIGLLRGRLRALVAVGATIALANVVAVAGPWPMKILIDSVLGDRPLGALSRHQALAVSIGMTVGLLIATGSLAVFSTRVQWGLAQGLTQDLRARLFAHLTRVSLRYHEKRTAGDTIYRITSDTSAVQNVLVQGAIPLASAILRLVLTLSVMMRLDVQLALLGVAAAPLAAVISYRFKSRIKSRALDLAERESAVYAHTEQTMSGIRTVQAFARESHEIGRFTEIAGDSKKSFVDLVTLQTIFKLLVDLVLGLGMGAVTWLAATRSMQGHLSPGEVLVLLAYAGALYMPIASLADVFAKLQSAAAGAQRVFEVLDEPALPGNEHAVPPRRRALGHLRADGVSFAYEEGHAVLHEVSFEAKPDELVALVGPTGAGKSTIVSLFLRLYDPTEGSISLDGVDVRELPLAWLREQVAFVPQDPVLFPASVRENIRYGRLDATDAEVEDAARAANLLDEIMGDPRGLDAPLGDRGVTLSGGQRQRVAIARAFLKDAPIIVLDEPTSALDATTEAAIMDAVAALARGRTTIVIAHRLATVERADKVLVVKDGRIVQSGTHARLIGRRGLYADLHRARFGSQPRLRVVHDAGAAKPSRPARAARGG